MQLETLEQISAAIQIRNYLERAREFQHMVTKSDVKSINAIIANIDRNVVSSVQKLFVLEHSAKEVLTNLSEKKTSVSSSARMSFKKQKSDEIKD